MQRLAQGATSWSRVFLLDIWTNWGWAMLLLERLNPGLIYTSVTPFGQTGPYRDYKGSELVAQAMGALVCIPIGLPDRPLRMVGMPLVIPQG